MSDAIVNRASARARRLRRSGSALLAAVLVVMMVAVLSLAYLQLSLNKNLEQKASVDAKRAFYMAEAGLSEAVIALASGQSGAVGSPSIPAKFGNGVFYVTTHDEDNGKTTLTSTGLCGCGRSALSMVVDTKKPGVAALGVFSDGTVTIEKGALIDSYDSRQGSYQAQHPALLPIVDPPTGSRVGSNADIVVRGAKTGLLNSGKSKQTSIYGEARPGPQGSVLRDNGVVITGSTAPNDLRVTLPAIVVPVIRSAGDLTVTSKAPARLSESEYAYGSLRLQSNAHAEIVGPTNIVVSSLELMPGAQLTFDASNGPVRVYVQDYLDLEKGSTLASAAQNPAGVALLINAEAAVDRNGDGIADPPATINAGGSFYGTIYAPKATVALPATLSLYGAIAAKQLSILAGAQVHFDQSLIDTSAEDSSVPHLSGWRIVPLPNTPLVSLHLDVLHLLQLESIVPPPASQAHYGIGVVPPNVPADGWNALQQLINSITHEVHGGPGPH